MRSFLPRTLIRRHVGSTAACSLDLAPFNISNIPIHEYGPSCTFIRHLLHTMYTRCRKAGVGAWRFLAMYKINSTQSPSRIRTGGLLILVPIFKLAVQHSDFAFSIRLLSCLLGCYGKAQIHPPLFVAIYLLHSIW